MKRNYIKPDINFESFGVTEDFATSVGICNTQADFQQNMCGVDIYGKHTFTAEVTGCTTVADDGYMGVCYGNVTGDNNVFLS